jgi:D-sedoheptulose 7-phosphate isomerase
MNLKEFTKNYIDRLNKLLNSLDINEIEKLKDVIVSASKNKSRVYILGNGGSASTASHMANDLRAGLGRRDILIVDAVSLTDNVAVNSALSNDIGYENAFYMQLKGILKKEDVVIAISCSGNSSNIVNAIEYANEVGSTIVGFSGFDGGKLKEISDVKIDVATPKGEYGLVEDIHLIINHIVFEYFQKEFDEK